MADLKSESRPASSESALAAIGATLPEGREADRRPDGKSVKPASRR
jgi:hypothetical protein